MAPSMTPLSQDEQEVTLYLRNFRGILHARWSPEGVVLLSGPNGSGKSTLLQALSFLQDYYDRGLQGAIAMAGGQRGCDIWTQAQKS